MDIYQNSQVPTGSLTLTLTDGSKQTLNVSDVTAAQTELNASDVTTYLHDVEQTSIFMTSILPTLIMAVVVIFLFMMMNRQAGGGNNKMMNFGKSRATMIMPDARRKTFKDVAGLQEEKEDLEELVDFLKEPQKYTKMGARIPKGVILVGPPGTGKTLLAKAVAGEAGVPFFSISGSDFVEMFVGVGASRVRDLFEDAKKNAPCIVFIDEIDAVARRRGTGMGGGHDEREQTLNQLLVEMDGFGVNEGIIVMAATNRVDILDPAILRPGRFDRKIGVGKPDVKGREEILKVHAKEKPLGDDVDLENIARTTAGFTGADLENLMNEAAIWAAKSGRTYIQQQDIQQAFIKVGIGAEKKSRLISDREKRITAYHEAGHALLFHLLPNVGPVHTVSIIPTGMGAAGYTMPLPEKDEMFMTKGKMLDTLMVDLGGRIAEELIIEDITTGASQDIKQATQLAKAMVTQYGMSERVGLIDYGNDEGEVFIGRDLAHSRGFSESMAAVIDEEVKRLIDEAHTKATAIIKEHIDVLHRCAALLIEKEKIGQEEFEALFGENA
ncbi:MAG: ATP-dependent zinc metalloprotease FtsH [Lachnospiraceae bacterium]